MRAAFAGLEARLESRMNRWFELGQGQHVELRQDFARLDARITELREDVSRLDAQLAAFYAEFRTFRDWVTEQFAELRAVIRQLTHRIESLEGAQKDLS